MARRKPKHIRVEEKKKMHIALKITLIILAVIFLLILSLFLYINAKLDLIEYDDEIDKSVYDTVDLGNGDSILGEDELIEDEEPDVDPETEVVEDIVDISGLEQIEEAPEISEGEVITDSNVLNILLIGTDERSNAFSTNARSDSMILVSIDKSNGAVKLVSLERGMGVPVLEGQYAGQYDWLTHIFRYGGSDLLVKTVRTCFKVDLDKYVRVNFNSVKQVVDMIGGIDVYLTYAEAEALNVVLPSNASTSTQPTLYEGMNHLDGGMALAYARLRSIDSDWQRVQRQRNVILAVVQTIKSSNLWQLDSLANSVLPLVQTNLSKFEIAELILYVPSFINSTFDQMTIPASGTYGGMTGMGGRGMFAPDFDLNSQILNEFLYG